MKRTLAWCLAGLMALSFAGCKKTEKAADATVNPPGAAVAAAENAQDAQGAAGAQADRGAAGAQDAQGAAGAEKAAGDAAAGAVPAPADVAAAPADAIKTESGLAYKKLTTNDEGRSVLPNDLVKLHYTGWTTDGKMFDTSTDHAEAAIFTPENLIPGMKEAIVLSKVGEKLRVWIPQDLAYKGAPGAPAGTLVFDFDIIDVVTPDMPPKDAPADAIKTASGIVYRVSKPAADGRAIGENDMVTLEFAGWSQANGTRFHSSLEMGENLSAPVNTMFPAWKEVLPLVHVGDVVQMWVPEELGIAPGSSELPGTLIFEVKVLSAKPLPQAPADLAAPGPDTQKTESGISWRIVTPGTGSEHPTATSRVKVHYSGWLTNGEMFDSSVARGVPIEIGLDQVIAGWTEAVQLMVPGEKRIVWIPEEHAYKGRPGAPAGTLVFEIELLEILSK